MKTLTYQTTVDIDAPVDTVWRVLADVGRWPEWTASVNEVDRLPGENLVVGARYRIRQPRLRPGVWTVTEWLPGVSFTWESLQPGVRLIAKHALEREGSKCRVHLDITFTGPMGWLFYRLSRTTTLRYMSMEAEGLRRRAEALH